MTSIVHIPLIAPLMWYQSVMVEKTISTFRESELLMLECLKKLDLNFNPKSSLQENLLQSGSIGYNYILDKTPMTRTYFSLENHGMPEKYALLIMENEKITNMSSYYVNSKRKVEIIKRNIELNSKLNCYTFSSCICSKLPKTLKFNFTENCLCCVNNWTPQNHSFYPELLPIISETQFIPDNLLL